MLHPPLRSSLALAALIGLGGLSACVRDADTVLEPDPDAGPVADAQPDGAPIEPAPAGPSGIEVDPPAIALDGLGSVAELTLRSVGEAPLTIRRISRRGDPGFAAVHGGRNVLLLSAAELSGDDGLAPGEAMVVRIEALVAPPAEAVLVIETDDPQRPMVEVGVGFPDTPCLRASPLSLDFGDVPLGESLQRSIRLENCGAVPIELRAVAVDGDPPQYELVQPPATGRIGPGAFVDVVVRYSARVAGPSRSALAVEATGVALAVPLTARAIEHQCPVAIAEPARWDVALVEPVGLDGSASIDTDGVDGRPVSWAWTVVDRPVGSTARPIEDLFDPENPADGGSEDDPGTPRAIFVPDRAGRFVLELEVVDADRCADTTRVVIEACPCSGDGITVQLDWTTPGDDDPLDGFGADADLHLLHPNAAGWFGQPYDCHYANPAPDWGQLGNPADDPQLDGDVAGTGPERIVLAVPEDTGALGTPYLVGVHLNGVRAAPGGQAPVIRGVPVEVRIYLGAELRYASSETLGDGEFWDVAGIDWPELRVEPRERVYAERP